MSILQLPVDPTGRLIQEPQPLVKRADSLPEHVVRRICESSVFWNARPCFLGEAHVA